MFRRRGERERGNNCISFRVKVLISHAKKEGGRRGGGGREGGREQSSIAPDPSLPFCSEREREERTKEPLRMGENAAGLQSCQTTQRTPQDHHPFFLITSLSHVNGRTKWVGGRAEHCVCVCHYVATLADTTLPGYLSQSVGRDVGYQFGPPLLPLQKNR